MRAGISSFSEVGPRKENEDAIFYSETGEQIVLAIADGLGGHGGGKLAANIALDTVKNCALAEDLGSVALAAHEAVRREQANGKFKGMATTLTVVRIVGDHLEGVHVGDTRCSIKRNEGIKKLTVSHTEAQRLLDAGKLTKQEFLKYPRRNILDNAIGAKDDIYFQSFEFDIKPNDYLILTTDGVHEKIFQKEMATLVHGSPEDITTRIRERVSEQIPEDNFSCVVAHIL